MISLNDRSAAGPSLHHKPSLPHSTTCSTTKTNTWHSIITATLHNSDATLIFIENN